MIYKVEGIIIRSVDYGEGNKIVTIFTKEMGKIGVMAKGAKKTKSRLAAVSQLFSHGYFVFYHGGGLGSLTSGDVIDSFRILHQDIVKTAWAAYIVELLDKVTEEKEPNAFLFYLLHHALSLIGQGKDPEMIARIIELQVLQQVGVKPVLHECAMCHRSDRAVLAFSIKEGGMLCESCLPLDSRAIVLSVTTIRLLRTLAQMDISKLGKVEIKDTTRKQLSVVMRAFIDSYVGVSIKSRNFLDQLNLFDTISKTNQKEDEDTNENSDSRN